MLAAKPIFAAVSVTDMLAILAPPFTRSACVIFAPVTLKLTAVANLFSSAVPAVVLAAIAPVASIPPHLASVNCAKEMLIGAAEMLLLVTLPASTLVLLSTVKSFCALAALEKLVALAVTAILVILVSLSMPKACSTLAAETSTV